MENEGTATIQIQEIRLSLSFSKKYIEEHGGVRGLKNLLYDIFDRYANEEYFNYDMLEE